jgi:hypothetical protein
MWGGFAPASGNKLTRYTGGGAFYALPTNRSTLWQPGVTYNGGIPTGRTQSGSTITSTGDTTDRLATIQAAIDAAPANTYVLLGTGNFTISGPIIIRKDNVTLRGTRTSTSVFTQLLKPVAIQPTTTGAGQSASPYNAITISRAAGLNLDGVTTAFAASTALTADGIKGTSTIAVTSVAGFSVGDLVRLDELSGAGWQPDPRADFASPRIWASSDFLVTYQDAETSPGVDDGLNDFSNGVLPSWFAAYTVADRPTCEMKKISAINGTNVTFSTPLHIDYRTAHTAKISKYNGTVITGAGVEDISCYGFDLGTFLFHLADSCWVQGGEANWWFDKPFNFEAAFRCEVRKSMHHNTPYPSNSAENYGFIFNWASADCLIEDSIGFFCDKVSAARAAGAGCVVGYCYLDAGTLGYSPSDTWVEVGANASHFVGCHHVLFEGNWAFNADSDFTHGNSVYVTHFRNWYTGFRSAFTTPGGNFTTATYNDITGVNTGTGTFSAGPNGLLRCAATNCFGYGHSFVGNILGTAGHTTGWVLESTTIFTDKAIWMPGWAPTASRPGNDPNVKNSGFWGAILRDGNYNFVTGTQLWDGLGGTASSAHTTKPAVSTLPNSLYQPSKPAFFGSNTWPWVDPVTGTLYTNPAKARWDAGSPMI